MNRRRQQTRRRRFAGLPPTLHNQWVANQKRRRGIITRMKNISAVGRHFALLQTETNRGEQRAAMNQGTLPVSNAERRRWT